MSATVPEFDVIVVGAGVAGGLPAGAYLQKAGARVLLVDGNNSPGIHCRSYEYSGGARCVPCAGAFCGGMMPLWDDLELDQYGAEMIMNRRIFGCVFPDDTSLFLGTDIAGTLRDIARFSIRDAWTFARFGLRMNKTRVEFNERVIYSEASPENLQRGYEILAYCCRLPVDELKEMNAFELLDHMFVDGYESSEVREALLYLATFWGLATDQPGVGHIASLWVYRLLNSSIVRGGNISLARALYQSFLESGGDSEYEANVDQLLVEDGKLVGVRLEGGREIRARAVVCAAALADDQPSPDEMPHNLTAYGSTSLLTCHYGYRGEAPVYRSAAFDPASNQAFIHVFGIQQPGDVKAVYQTVESGEIPAGHGRALCATQFDEFHAGFSHVHGPLQTLRFEVPAPARLDTDSKTLRTSWRGRARSIRAD